MRFTLLALVAICTALLSACADSHMIKNHSNSTVLLPDDGFAYIAVPRDGRYGEIVYAGSGAMVTQVLNSAFMPHMERVEEGRVYEELKNALISARKMGASHLVFPSILHWEDRATEWSAISDKVEIGIAIYEVSSGQSLQLATIAGRSGLATFGGDHPQDLLPEPTKEYVDGLF